VHWYLRRQADWVGRVERLNRRRKRALVLDAAF